MTGVPRYELLCKIASGGAGSVYVARVAGTVGVENLVAVKRPHTHLVEVPGFRESFFAEARIASRIRHPNVVAVRNVAVEGDAVRLVMDYVEGASLASLRGAEPVPLHVALRILLDACAGLHAAHEVTSEDGRALRVVHRDVSPQNLLVGTDGVCRITDFGIAKCLAENTAESTQGLLKGKVAYMAPEQVHGEAVDRRADVFALGIVAWEMLTGERLFRGANDAESVMRVLALEPRPPSQIERTVPSDLDAVVLRALSKSKEARQATAAELGADLARAAGSSIASRADVASWLRPRAQAELERRRAEIALADTGEPTADATPATDAAPSAVPMRRRRRFVAAAAVVGVVAASAFLVRGLYIGGSTIEEASRARVDPTSPPTSDAPPPVPAMAALTETDASSALDAAPPVATERAAAKPARRRPRRSPAAPQPPASAHRFKAPRNPYE